MKLVLDMNLPRDWAHALAARGHEVLMWRDVGDKSASDEEIAAYAVLEGAVVLTQDLDFGDILASSNASGPSVVLIRSADFDLDEVLVPVARVLESAAQAIERGAIVSVDPRRARVRLLPLRP